MTEINKPMLAGHLLDALYHSVRDGKAIDNIPGLIEQLLAEDIWKEVYVEEIEQTITYERFEDFLITPPPEGLGTKADILKRLIGDDNRTLNLLDEALQGKPGAPLGNLNQSGTIRDTVTNSRDYKEENKKRGTGNTRQAGIRRLRKDRPDLLQRVLDKELNVNQAMIEAGFRTRWKNIPADVNVAAKKLKDFFDREQLDQLIEKLRE